MKKMVVTMDVYDDISKRRVMQTVAECPGIATISMDTKDGKLTVIGELDIKKILTKLERRWRNVKMQTFGPCDPKKEAETAAAAKKHQEEVERERSCALNRSYHENSMHHHQIVCDHDHYHGCTIS